MIFKFDTDEEEEIKSVDDETIIEAHQEQLVRCLECNCIGTLWNTAESTVLRPDKVKTTLPELGGGFFMPKYLNGKKDFKMSLKEAKQVAEQFNKSADEGKNESGLIDKTKVKMKRAKKFIKSEMELLNIIEIKREGLGQTLEFESRKTTEPKKYTGLFSDEFEEDDAWKSWKRFALQ